MCSKLKNYKIEISYDGSLFHGFQKQLNLKTVQSVIEKSTDLILQNYDLNYAGRTDAGVHAKQMFGHFDCDVDFEIQNLIFKMNSFLLGSSYFFSCFRIS